MNTDKKDSSPILEQGVGGREGEWIRASVRLPIKPSDYRWTENDEDEPIISFNNPFDYLSLAYCHSQGDLVGILTQLNQQLSNWYWFELPASSPSSQEPTRDTLPYIPPMIDVPDEVRFKCAEGGKQWAESHNKSENYAVSSLAFAMGAIIMFDGVRKGLYDEFLPSHSPYIPYIEEPEGGDEPDWEAREIRRRINKQKAGPTYDIIERAFVLGYLRQPDPSSCMVKDIADGHLSEAWEQCKSYLLDLSAHTDEPEELDRVIESVAGKNIAEMAISAIKKSSKKRHRLL